MSKERFIVRREIWASTPAIDGRFEKMSQLERDDFTKRLFYFTKKFMGVGAEIPVTDGHGSPFSPPVSEELHGKLVGIELERQMEPYSHLVILGDMELDKKYFTLYQEGKLPGVSIEYTDYANLLGFSGFEDKIESEFIYSVALMGQTVQGLPNLRMISERVDSYGIVSHFSRQRFKYGDLKSELEGIVTESLTPFIGTEITREQIILVLKQIIKLLQDENLIPPTGDGIGPQGVGPGGAGPPKGPPGGLPPGPPGGLPPGPPGESGREQEI